MKAFNDEDFMMNQYFVSENDKMRSKYFYNEKFQIMHYIEVSRLLVP